MRLLRERRLLISLLVLGLLTVAGCGKNVTANETVSGLYFDTIVSITAYDDTSAEIMRGALDKCRAYEQIFSKTDENSELYKINHRQGMTEKDGIYSCEISPEMYEVLLSAIQYNKEFEGVFNPALGSVTELWNYHDENPQVPDEETVNSRLINTDCSCIDAYRQDGKCYIAVSDENVIIDLGAIAKGYIANKLRDYFVENNSREIVIKLGGNVYCIGNKGGNGYNVGIQKPFAGKGQMAMTIAVSDTSVVTSGIYERYFDCDGHIYHHIIDSNTGYPSQSDLSSVTVICADSMKADVLSTTLLCMGSERAYEYSCKDSEIRVILITREGKIIDTEDN